MDGHLHGLFEEHHEDGTLWERSNQKHGQYHGMQELYYPDGVLYSKGEFINNRKIGLWYRAKTRKYL